MPLRSDLQGKRFGKLEVVEKADTKEDGYVVWRCRCDCGGEIFVNTKRLKRGTVTNCGCIKKMDSRYGHVAEDLTGRKFGCLTVLERAENHKGRTSWLCQCTCGNTHITTSKSLKDGKCRSCGCQRNKIMNSAVDLQDRQFGRLTALHATKKRDKKGSVFWHCVCKCGNEVDVTADCLIHGSYKSCGCLQKEHQQNIHNTLHFTEGTCIEWLEKRKERTDNSSGVRGVYQTPKGQYRATIGFKGKQYHIGTFSDMTEASRARNEAEKLIHDGFLKAYYAWQEYAKQCREEGMNEEEIPQLIFEVYKKNGILEIETNMEDMKKKNSQR